MKRIPFFILWLLAFALASPARAQNPASSTAPASQPAPAQPAISLTETVTQSEAIKAELRAADLAGSPVTDDIASQLPLSAEEIASRAMETRRILDSRPTLQDLTGEDRFWQARATALDLWKNELLDQGALLDTRIARFQQQLAVWQQVLSSARTADAARQNQPRATAGVPPEILARIQDTVSALHDALDHADSARATLLSLQTELARQHEIVAGMLSDVRQQRDQAMREIFTRDGTPLWQLRFSAPPTHQRARPSITWSTQFVTLLENIQTHPELYFIQAFLFVIFALALLGARAKFKNWQAAEPALAPAAAVFDRPLAAALLLALILGLWIHAQAPQIFWTLCSLLAIFPATILIRRLTERYLDPLVFALVSFFFVDQFRAFVLGFYPLPRILFLAEMLAAAIFLAWFIRTRRRSADRTRLHRLRIVLNACRAAFVFVSIAFLANALGFNRLSFLVGNAVMRSAYLAMILYTTLSITDGLVIILLHLRPFTTLAAIRKHAPLLRRRIRRFLNWAAIAFWIFLILQLLFIVGPVHEALSILLTTPAHFGDYHISLGQILAAVITAWAAFAISRFIRFLLEEEVYPNVSLPRGLNTALSLIIHYLILVVGFAIALALLGYPLTQLTILTGAFGVGLGFGLQTIINNFFSGLIVLAERPIRVGDVIEMDGIAGTVVRIGIRATIYRTSDGSEIIMPNARLIAERVINWTFSDRDRGFDIPIAVDAAADPKHVIELLQNTARNFPGVSSSPPAYAQLTGFNAGSFNFTLTAYAASIDNWKQVRSDLALALQATLKKENIPIK